MKSLWRNSLAYRAIAQNLKEIVNTIVWIKYRFSLNNNFNTGYMFLFLLGLLWNLMKAASGALLHALWEATKDVFF